MNFIKYWRLYVLISAVVLIPGCISLVLFGLKPSIDFTGGTLLEVVTAEPRTAEELTAVAESVTPVRSVQPVNETQFILKADEVTTEKKNELVTAMDTQLEGVSVLRFEAIGPTLSKELVNKTLTAIVLVAIFIILYVAYQFSEWKYGISAILAMLHDTLVLLGAFSLLGHFLNVEVDVLFVTAVLTTLSFSVHDTIVVYHRIHEIRQKNRQASIEEVLNTAVTGTLTRSINNSMTIILMLLALTLLGGDTIRWFSVALLIGAVTGTYSSACVAIPLLYGWEKFAKRKK